MERRGGFGAYLRLLIHIPRRNRNIQCCWPAAAGLCAKQQEANHGQNCHCNRNNNPDPNGLQNTESAQKNPEVENGEHKCQEHFVHRICFCNSIPDENGTQAEDEQISEYLDSDDSRGTELVLKNGRVENTCLQKAYDGICNIGHSSNKKKQKEDDPSFCFFLLFYFPYNTNGHCTIPFAGS